jgi:hypothetical protein
LANQRIAFRPRPDLPPPLGWDLESAPLWSAFLCRDLNDAGQPQCRLLRRRPKLRPRREFLQSVVPRRSSAIWSSTPRPWRLTRPSSARRHPQTSGRMARHVFEDRVDCSSPSRLGGYGTLQYKTAPREALPRDPSPRCSGLRPALGDFSTPQRQDTGDLLDDRSHTQACCCQQSKISTEFRVIGAR